MRAIFAARSKYVRVNLQPSDRRCENRRWTIVAVQFVIVLQFVIRHLLVHVKLL